MSDVFSIFLAFMASGLFILLARDFNRLRRMTATGWRPKKAGIFWLYFHPCGTEYDSFRMAWKRFKDDLYEAEIKMYGDRK